MPSFSIACDVRSGRTSEQRALKSSLVCFSKCTNSLFILKGNFDVFCLEEESRFSLQYPPCCLCSTSGPFHCGLLFGLGALLRKGLDPSIPCCAWCLHELCQPRDTVSAGFTLRAAWPWHAQPIAALLCLVPASGTEKQLKVRAHWSTVKSASGQTTRMPFRALCSRGFADPINIHSPVPVSGRSHKQQKYFDMTNASWPKRHAEGATMMPSSSSAAHLLKSRLASPACVLISCKTSLFSLSMPFPRAPFSKYGWVLNVPAPPLYCRLRCKSCGPYAEVTAQCACDEAVG